jgi:hypothetical protein
MTWYNVPGLFLGSGKQLAFRGSIFPFACQPVLNFKLWAGWRPVSALAHRHFCIAVPVSSFQSLWHSTENACLTMQDAGLQRAAGVFFQFQYKPTTDLPSVTLLATQTLIFR